MNYKLPDRDSYKKTDRGFAIFDEFNDRYDADVLIQESSIAFEPCVWVYALDKEEKPTMIHLTPAMAERTIAALQKFIEVSKLEEVEHEEDD